MDLIKLMFPKSYFLSASRRALSTFNNFTNRLGFTIDETEEKIKAVSLQHIVNSTTQIKRQKR